MLEEKKQNDDNRKRKKQILIRATEEEYKSIEEKRIKSKLSKNDYMLHSALNKKIVVVEGVRDITLELKKVGNNLNQITKAMHEGKIQDCSHQLDKIDKELKDLWQLSSRLAQKQV